MTPKHGDSVQLADRPGWFHVNRVEGNVLHVADCATHHESCVSVHAVTRVEVHPGGAGS